MKNLFATAAAFGMSCMTISLCAQTLTSPSPQAATPTSQQGVDEKEIGNWKMDTAQVAKDYVEGLDRGDYSQSWSKADPIFKRTITQKEWIEALNMSRKKYGPLKSRKLKEQGLTHDPRGLPKGAYVVVEFDTSFENKPNVIELLTLKRGSDGKWRVLTYDVKN